MQALLPSRIQVTVDKKVWGQFQCKNTTQFSKLLEPHGGSRRVQSAQLHEQERAQVLPGLRRRGNPQSQSCEQRGLPGEAEGKARHTYLLITLSKASCGASSVRAASA
eukprot:2882301-Amphidinium_carterae.1